MDVTTQSLVEHLGGFVTEHKREVIEEVLGNRTYHITVAIEDIYQSHNASAVLRTCDCLGIQDIYVMENWNDYTVNPNVTMGSSKWLDIHRYNEEGKDNTTACFTALKEKGYRLIGTSPHDHYPLLEDFKIDDPFALIFGNELEGMSEKALNAVDEMVRIPIFGFTESYNISVSAAICLYTLVQRMRSEGIHWQLTEDEKLKLRHQWYRKIVKGSEVLEQDFLRSIDNPE